MCQKAILFGSTIGAIIGLIPGIGCNAAGLISHGQGKRFFKKVTNFGKGAIEGVAVAESANSAVYGTNLLPLVTLGIPGSGSMAVLLVVMGYHGLSVGPRLFSINGDIAYAVLWSQFGAAFMVLVIGTLLAYIAYRVAYLNVSVIIPVVCVFALIGGFAPNEYVFDMGLVVVFGVLGYAMKKHGYPPIAMLLGVILGPLFEGNLLRGLKMGLGSPIVFFNRPLAIILWCLLIITFSAPPIIKAYSTRKRSMKVSQ